MKHFSLHHKETGLFMDGKYTVSDDRLMALNTPADHVAIEGHHDHLSKRVDIATGEVVDYQPPQPSEHHEWNAATRRWQINAARQAKLDAHADAMRKIAALEVVQARYLREVHLGVNLKQANQRLEAIEDEIVELRKFILQELL